jgi:predicted Zn-dependent protease
MLKPAISIFLMANLSVAQAKGPKLETHTDIIEKAYALSVQKDREHAALLLAGALKKESGKTAAADDIRRALEEIGQVFQTDKNQQIYEQALSDLKTDPQAAKTKLTNLLLAEPEHLLVMLSLTRLQLRLNDCRGAEATLGRMLGIYSHLEEVRLAQAQTNECLSPISTENDLKKNADVAKSEIAWAWLTLQAQVELRLGLLDRAKLSLNSIVDKKYPEKNYFLWKLSNLEKKPSPEFAQKYLDLCRSLSARQERLYFPEPRLCQRVQEVENMKAQK